MHTKHKRVEFVPIERMPHFRDLLKELLDIDEGLDEWTVDFIESLSNWAGSFTVSQAVRLELVHERET